MSAARHSMSPRHFLAKIAFSAMVLSGVVWLWVGTMQLAFLDPEYPSWRAKQIMLMNCHLGDIVVLGDSRAATAMMPTRWKVPTANLALGGGEPIEALAALTRAMRCPVPPTRAILSFDAVHFAEPDLFWERTARFGFVDADEIATLRDTSRALTDTSIYELRHTDGLPSLVRDALYQVRFPSLYFSSLMKGGLLLRWAHNHAALHAGLASRGQYFFGTAAGSHTVAAEGHLRKFLPLPVLAWYFDQLLRRLDADGVPAVFVAVPMNDATARHIAPGVRVAFRNWLARYEARYPGFRVAGDVMPAWPDEYFGDGFAHLNQDGAVKFSDGLGRCLDAPFLTTECIRRLQAAPPDANDERYGWFSGTRLDAAAKVGLGSRRGP